MRLTTTRSRKESADDKINLVLTALISIHFNLFLSVNCWHLQLCLNGSVLETSNARCKYGVWFNEPKVVHQICFENGVWAIYRDFCESNPIIWTVRPGTRGCLSKQELGDEILGIVPIGRDEYGAIVSTSRRRLFFNNHKLKHGMRMNFLNPPAEVEILTWGPSSYTFSLQQFVGKDVLQQCLIKGHHSFFGYYKISLDSYQNVSFFLAKNICLKRQTEADGPRSQLLPSPIDFDIIQSSSEDVVMRCERYRTIQEHIEEPSEESLGMEPKSNLSDYKRPRLPPESTRSIESRVDQETQRIALRLLAHHFNEDGLELPLEEWEFLDVAKQIFLKTCPVNMVPPFFINQIHLLFQGVLYESFKLFPNHVNRDYDAKGRILETLKSCLSDAKPLKFKPGAVCTKDAPLLKKEFVNGSKVYLLVDMPSFVKVDVVNYDLIMESIWKLMNFVHYYCADTFQAYSSDHSLLEDHWYSLFSPQVIRRWKYPGRTFRVMKQIFMSIDLERSIKNLDFCVSAARLHSSYKGWLKRPLSHWDRARKYNTGKGSKLIWEGQAHCMDDFMYPAFKLGYPIEKCGIRLPKLPRRLF